MNGWDKNEINISKQEFIKYFGMPNILKNNRYSWSGRCVPKYGEWNDYGQIMEFTENLDLYVMYSFSIDQRENKETFPEQLKKDNIIIVFWKREKLEKHVNNKYNKKGFSICKKINNKYENICFGSPFNFTYFVENIKNKNIFFDSGMYEGNRRNYSHFRSFTNNFWNTLITEEY